MEQKTKRLNLCSIGLYKIIYIQYEETQNRLLEIGILPGQNIYIIRNNSLGIQVRINRTTYILNQVVASAVYVQPLGE